MPEGKMMVYKQKNIYVKGKLTDWSCFIVKSTDHYLPPLREDFEGLLGRFQLTESVRYEHFAPIWREMNLSSIH